MSLYLQSNSNESESLASHLAGIIHSISIRKNGVTGKLRQAVGAILADLLSGANRASNPYLFRPSGLADFRGQRIGYRCCIEALTAMKQLGLVDRIESQWLGTHRRGEGYASSYRATPLLLEEALRFGITPGNWRSHFTLAPRPTAMAHPVMVRAKRQYWDDDEKGKAVSVDKRNPCYVAAAAQVNHINSFMATQDITGCDHGGFVRIFNHGDQTGFDFNMGGRLYSKASSISYQNAPKVERHGFRINGEPVVELDLRASFLTIFYALNGLTLDRNHDPYIIGNIPRDVVKAWIAMTFGYERFHAKWSDETVKHLIKRKTGPIYVLRDHPIETIKDAVLQHHPLLESWPDSTIRWPQLQYLESTAIIDAIETLGIENNVASLPLHDALLIGRPMIDIASSILNDTFARAVGVDPVFKVKDDWE